MLGSNPALSNSTSKTGESAVLLAVYYGREDVAEELISKGAEMDIFAASALGKVERVRELLEMQPDLVNANTSYAGTPLANAAYFGQLEVAKLLIGRGTEVNPLTRNQFGNTALHAAIAGRNRDLVEFLLAKGADVRARDSWGSTPLSVAAHEGMKEIAELLIAQGSDVNDRRSKDGKTPLTVALEEGHLEVAELLRHNGASK